MDKEIDSKRIKRKPKLGFCISFVGALFIIYALLMGSITGWVYIPLNDLPDMANYAIWSILSMGIGILLLSIGIFLILHNRSKASKN